jgi:biopolymer transport protein ExbD
MTTSISSPSEARAKLLGVRLPPTGGESLALVVAIVLLVINVCGTGFFLVYLRGLLGLQASSAVTVPNRKPAAAPSPSGELVLYLKGDGTVLIDDEPVALDALAAAVSARAPQRVLLRAEAAARYPQAKAVLQELRRAGATNVTFSVLQPKNDAPLEN